MPKRKDATPPYEIPAYMFIATLIYCRGGKPYEVEGVGVTERFFRNWLSGTYNMNDASVREAARFFGLLPERVLKLPKEVGED